MTIPCRSLEASKRVAEAQSLSGKVKQIYTV